MNNSFNPNIEQELLIRFLSNEATEPEKQLVQDWLRKDMDNLKYFEELSTIWKSGEDLKSFSLIDAAEDWEKVRERMYGEKDKRKVLPLYKKPSWIKQLSKVAAVFILLGLVLFWVNSNYWKIGGKDETSYTSTAQTTEFTLPDGTNVHLNKDSYLSYNEEFGKEKREVKLVGEAFFEVKQNKEKPFLVRSGTVVTQVIGTSFNIYSYSKDTIKVTVLTGKVSLQKKANTENKIMMTAGERGTYIKGDIQKSVNQDLNFISWKTGILTFKHTPLVKVIHDLEKHYGQKIQLENNEMESCELTSTFKNRSLDEVLAELELVLSININKKDNIIIISGEGC